MSVCARTGCYGSASFRPVLEWYPDVEGYTGRPAEMEIGLYVCGDHAERDQVETARLCVHFLPAAVAACRVAGKATPDPLRTRIRWERIQ